ncbi:hypothetical protein PM082_019226 [Marasmius tenuissimus]|nr:hypothetical protein PM082_019226 [Marasmius tenuissimus]
MWARWNAPAERHHHFYVCKLVQTKDSSYVVPVHWVTIKGVDYGDVYAVHVNAMQRITAELLQYNSLDLSRQLEAGEASLAGMLAL